MNSVHTITLVACSKEKRSDCRPAQDLYTSPLFSKARAYAEQLGHEWFVISAKWGLLVPHSQLMPYDQTIRSMTPEERSAWGAGIANRLASIRFHRDAERLRVVLLAGRSYAGWVPLMPEWCEVVQPMEGLQVGERLAWLNAQLSQPALFLEAA